MINQGIAGALAGPDTTVTTKPGSKHGNGDGAETKGGFTNALSKARGDNQEKSKGNETAQADETSATPDDGDAAETASSRIGLRQTSVRNAAPLVDLQPSSLRTRLHDASEETAVTRRADEKLGERKTARNAMAAGKLQSETDDAAVAEPKADARLAAAAKAAAKATVGDESAVAPDPDAAVQGDAKTPVNDALSLLSETTAQAVAAAVESRAQQTPNTAAEHGRTGKKEAENGASRIAAADNDDTDALDAVSLPGTVTDETKADARTFRFSRADGRGQSMDMTVSGRQGDSSEQASGSIENVTVLDSRRYLGFSSNSNSQALVNTIIGDSEWSGAMHPDSALSNAAAAASTGKVVNTLKIQMHPIDLGAVTATLRLSGDQLSVEITVETGAAYRQLKDDQSSIMDALRAQGFAVDQVSVSMAPADKSDAGNNSQSNNQNSSFNQQASQGDARGGAASGREERFAGRNQNGNAGAADEAVGDTVGISGSDGTRPDHVYI